jgi:hypothetical protein
MMRKRALVFGLCLVALAVSPLAAPLAGAPAKATQPARDIVCYVVMEEGQSSEGNSLFMRKMGVDPEALKTFAPARFSRSGGKFAATVKGDFAYQAESPTRVARSGRLALYEVPLRIKADPPPKPTKTVKVSLSLAELAKAGGIVQPAFMAMDKAAAAQKMSEGTAWIIEMSHSGKGKLKAVVGLAK